MLAKMWKKVLLAICIIACIYNIMSKLVNRASLEANLQRANDGNTIFDFSSKDSKSNTSEIVDGVISKNIVVENTTVDNKIVENEVITEEVTTNESVENQPEEQEQEESSSNGVKFTDLIFKW